MSQIDDKLKPVEANTNAFQINFNRTTTTLSGPNLFFTKADRTDLTNRPYGNLFASFNLPITQTHKNDFLSGGTFYNTALQNINQDTVIIVEVPKNLYGEVIDGKTITLNIPQKTGSTEYQVSLYCTYFSDSTQNTVQGNNNTQYSDSTPQAEYFGVPSTNENNYQTNIGFLFSNSIKSPQVNTGTTWGAWTTTYKFDPNNPLSNTNTKQFAQFDGQYKDQSVGIAYLDKGFFVITDPTLVANFNYTSGFSSGYDDIISGSTYSGSTDFTQIYFTGSSYSNASFASYTTEFVQNITCIGLPNEFYESTNPTYFDVYPNGNLNNDPVYITEIGLYNANKELIAIAKLSQPIPKNKFNTISFNINLKI